MSRFGLRSNSDGVKLSEERKNGKNLHKTSKVSRRVDQKKRKPPLLNDGENSSEEQPPSSLVCSFPLSRLSGILEKLNLTPLKGGIKNENESQHEEMRKEGEAVKGDYEKEKPDTAKYQKPAKTVIKILCLYCDKQFTSHKMQLNHVEKSHTEQRDRRCSGRKSQTLPLQRNSKELQDALQHFPGCTYCNKTKTQRIVMSANDLNELYVHLTECHSDKYFGCKLCVLRFQTFSKLSKHMQVVHKNLPFPVDDSAKPKDSESDTLLDQSPRFEPNKVSRTRLQRIQKILPNPVPAMTSTLSQVATPISPDTVIGVEEPILARLGLTQNRLPSNRKGVRLRSREGSTSDAPVKSEQPTTFQSPTKIRNTKTVKTTSPATGGIDADVVFRVPARTELFSCVFDDNFYKEVISNVRNNLLYHLDGKVSGNADSSQSTAAGTILKQTMPQIRSTLVKSPIVLSGNADSEIHAATSLTATTAFPTLLTAEQYGGDVTPAKIRRPHTKHSWKWKWDCIKKFKLINEGGKVVKKVKQPMQGLRDLSKLDMWTQLTMRQKHESQQHQVATLQQQVSSMNESTREEKQRVSDQLNYILDMRLLPHIILEQNEQAIIKQECDEPQNASEDCAESIVGQTFSDENFLSMLDLLPQNAQRITRTRLVLSGEWARPRCYMCMCCSAKFEKLKSLEEHKIARHSHIFSTHYEVVGRELLADNLLRHLFSPKRALSRYGGQSSFAVTTKRGLAWTKTEPTAPSSINVTPEDESSDSVQSIPNSCTTTHTCSIKQSTTDDCDTDTKTTLDINTVSPAHSMQSCSSLFMTPMAKMQAMNKDLLGRPSRCTKCNRKCNGVLDLYRHLLDCSGDYIWSLAKKRKYRYYCGSKKRRPCNKHIFAELRKNKPKCVKASPHTTNDTEESSNSSKTKTPPRQRPSDAESIKKMLENLPPKRICKKIFPTLTKSKAKQNNKSQLLAKHKMFNTKVLRKTRSRQMSHKLLSKTKKQFPTKETDQKSLNLLKQRTKKLGTRKKQVVRNSTTAKTSNRTSQRERGRNPKDTTVEVKTTKETKENAIKSKKATEGTNTTSELIPENSVELKSEVMSIAVSQPNDEVTKVCVGDSLETKKSELQLEAQNTTDMAKVNQDNAVKTLPENTEGSVSNRKRSKKISDCIAMLTGKLEEKLKTEQKVVGKNEAFAEATTSQTQEVVLLEPQPRVQAQKTDTDCKTTNVNEKKTPKRKTFSRRIIKADNLNTKLSIEPLGIKASTTTTTTTTVPLMLPPAPPLAKQLVNLPTRVEVSLPLTISPAALPNVAVSTASIPMPLNMLPKLPIYIPVENLRAGVLPTVTALPLSMPVENMPPQLLPTVTVLPGPLAPPAPPQPLLPTALVHNFSMEPLNLSSVKRTQLLNVSQDLSCQTAQRHGIPTRRQTICGFEARNFLVLDDMEPLDLSKKPKKELVPSLPSAQSLGPSKAVESCTLSTPSVISPASSTKSNEQLPVLSQSLITLPLPPNAIALCPEALLNKQFYSNLDLLKIPQVRNPVYMPALQMSTNEIMISHTATTPKCTKKRNTASVNNNNNTKNITESPGCASNKPLLTATDMPAVPVSLPVSKKENTKSKPVLKMDEEVINHIDDAINSVINAVKATLAAEDKMALAKAKPKQETAIEEKTPPVLNVNEETTKEMEAVMPTNHLMLPQKRSMRSKTLDCRPVALKTPISANTANTPPQKDSVDSAVMPSKANELINAQNEQAQTQPIDDTKTPFAPNSSPNKDNSTENIKESVAQTEEDTKAKSPQSTKPEEKSNLKEVAAQAVQSTLPTEQSSIHKDNTSPLPTSIETIVNSVSEENISNINNTSSGFHSSCQTETALPDAKKKQRRRRKNELAAIVADQLLESFKIDKARRDNLKKLENLAYEKSEDLLLTGMLLMSHTKRSCQPTNQQQGLDKVHPTDSGAKRQKSVEESPKQHQTKSSNNSSNERKLKVVNATNIEKPISPKNEKKGKKESATDAKKATEADLKKSTVSKRRPYRRRGKTLDNENISKLKSSLESFSIGIEKQLSEIEAKKESALNAADPKASKSVASAPPKASILRPSILSSVALEQCNAEATNKTANQSSENKSVFSRDPRLNKNIHKDEQDAGGGKSVVEKPREQICDIEEEDNYLTEIAKNVNEKIMSAENEDFVCSNDGFELANDMQDDSNSRYRPSTSMSVRSAPNFNDDHSNFGSTCDENTNTEVMDMDLDDEMSIYTSYSQDLGRGRGRRRRRRRSILLRRRPKKRPARDLSAEKFDCELCKKTFYTANSLTKHNQTLLHVSKVSELEYLQSKSNPAPSTRISRAKSPPTISSFQPKPPSKSNKSANEAVPLSITTFIETPRAIRPNDCHTTKTTETSKENGFNTISRLTLNPDEKLFFECCNILKGAETPRHVVNNEDGNNGAFTYSASYADKPSISSSAAVVGSSLKLSPTGGNGSTLKKPIIAPERLSYKSAAATSMVSLQPSVFRDPPQPTPSTANSNKPYTQSNSINEQRNLLSPNYSAISQFSAATNTTTSRFKTKAAMKGYENVNVNVDLTIQQELESKSKAICKLTELAEIALGTEKPSAEFSSITAHREQDTHPKRLNTCAYSAASATIDNPRICHLQLNRDRQKNTAETQSSTSSKTIMHSSIIKAAVEEHNKTPTSKIIIPERPFKNIGLEEKETITFQKPKTAVNLLTEDNNSMSSLSYSDRDDFDFNSMSDDDTSVRTTNEKNVRNDSTDSSSSRVTTKTLENKSLIMGRIFKNANSKTKAAPKAVKSVGVQKDQAPKADLNQLFDELRGEVMGKMERHEVSALRKEYSAATTENVRDKYGLPPLPETKIGELKGEMRSEPGNSKTATRKSKDVRKKSSSGKKSRKDISKLQSELGMTPEEIEKLIDEGQRKSKRRCATNRPKKLVEMWSSDEYEEFLSTKDIIALIEEKEKQEKRRKHKRSVTPSETKEKERESKKESAVENKRRNVRSLSLAEHKDISVANSTMKSIEDNEKERRRTVAEEKWLSLKIASEAERCQESNKERPARIQAPTVAESKHKIPAESTALVEKPNTDHTTSASRLRNKKKKENTSKGEELVVTEKDASSRSLKPNEPVTAEKLLLAPAPSPIAMMKDEFQMPDPQERHRMPNQRTRANREKNDATTEEDSTKKKHNANTEDTKKKDKRSEASVEDGKRRDGKNCGSVEIVRKRQKRETVTPELDIKEESDINRREVREKEQKDVNVCIVSEDVNNLEVLALGKESVTVATLVTADMESKKPSNNNNNSSSGGGSKPKTSSHKSNKRKSQPKQSTPRRKRLASEKLYYWSSSSDEDFGRINASPTQELDTGEQYQKHGWIVGDSHKKLVTLLAIAKGNNKVENCGVKKNVPKKKS